MFAVSLQNENILRVSATLNNQNKLYCSRWHEPCAKITKAITMYILDIEKNELISAENCSFKELKLKERQHLQEWIAKEPSVLKEELLIIQKEFDGFSDTHERLDLLALDKRGNIVVIENKLDDSGRDVTWQAIKYASYCSSLSKDEIIAIYAKYLCKSKEEAEDKIVEFFEAEDLEDVELNKENTQRIIFVAANFRKEVTSSVLWLRGFGIDASCVKVSPFKYNGKVLVDFDQIIPVVEAEEYTIKMAEKKKAEAKLAAQKKANENKNSAFWAEFIEYSHANQGLYSESSGSSSPFLVKGLDLTGVSVQVWIGKQASVRINIHTKTKEENDNIFEFLSNYKEEIEKELGKLEWDNENKICKISKCVPLSYLKDEEIPEIFKFFNETSPKFFTLFKPLIEEYKRNKKQ